MGLQICFHAYLYGTNTDEGNEEWEIEEGDSAGRYSYNYIKENLVWKTYELFKFIKKYTNAQDLSK